MKKNILKKLVTNIVTASLVLSSCPLNIAFGAPLNKANNNGVFKLHDPNITASTSVGRADVYLDWDDHVFKVNGDDVASNYFIVRRPVYYAENNETINKYGEWEVRGKYGQSINVLNVYPNTVNSSGFKSWMEEQSLYENVDINVTSQTQNDFSNYPNRYLTKSADGTYNYDVIVFGFADSYNNARMTATAAKIVQEFIDSGYGVVFGHDVVQTSAVDKGFNSLVQNNLDIFLTPKNRPTWYVSDLVGIKKQGSLTTYPFDINGMDLNIPLTHTVAQFPGNTTTGVPNDDIVYMTLEPNYYPTPEDGPYFHYNTLTSAKGPETTVSYKLGNNPTYEYIANAYLLKQDNVAFIQSGHTNGDTSEAEQMVLANLCYALAQINTQSHTVDQILDDVGPSIPTNSYGNLVFESFDFGVGYEYRIVATPIGYDMSSIDKDLLQTKLSSNENKFNDNVVFSNSFYTGELTAGLKGSAGYEKEKDQATFRYYINKNAVGTRIPPFEIPGKEDLTDDFFTLGYNQSFDYTKHYTDVSKITDNTYLHVVAFDRANNISKVANFKLKDLLEKSDVTINYEYNGQIIKTETISALDNPNLIVGTKFSSNAEKNYETDEFKYIYSHTVPTNKYITISADPKKNVITHVYDKLVTKDIYIVERRPAINNGTATENATIYMTESVEAGSNINIAKNIPDYSDQNFTFVGFSQGAEPDFNSRSTDAEFIWTDDTDNIYLYYEKNIATVKITINRTDGKEFATNVPSYTIEKQGYVGESITLTGNDIKSKVTVRNLSAFSNRTILDNYKKTFILSDKNSIYKDTISLTPRTLSVVGIGIDYGNESGLRTTSSSGLEVIPNDEKAVSINKNLFTVTKTYDLELKPVEFAPPTITDNTDGGIWKNYIDEVDGQSVPLDFSTNKNLQIAYYKGIKPTEAYSVTTNFLNILDKVAIEDQKTTGTLNVANQPNISIYEELTSDRVADRDVDFILEKYEVTLDNNTVTYPADTDLNDIVPFRDSNGAATIGDYEVNAYYRPVAKVYYTEDIYDVTGTKVISSKTSVYDTPYDDEEKSVVTSLPLDEYQVSVSDNAVYSNKQVSTKITAYDNYVTTKYIPLVYNLQIAIIDKDKIINKVHYVYEFKNIPVKKSVTFTVPNYEDNNYYFNEAVMVLNGTENDFSYGEDNKITFDPVKNAVVNGKIYKMELHYKYLSDLFGTYTVYRNNQPPLVKEITGNAFMGEKVSVTTAESDLYDLTYVYLDGKEYADIEEGTEYEIKVTKPVHYLELIYHEVKFDLNVEAMTSGGVFDGGGEYYKGEKVYIHVEPDENYKLEKLVVDGAEVTLTKAEGVVDYYYFIMPDSNLTIKAYFILDEEDKGEDKEESEDEKDDFIDGDIISPGSGAGGSNITDPTTTDPIITNPIIEPEIPTKPIVPTQDDILELVNNSYYSVVRQYKSYLAGYPDGNVLPDTYIRRSEVINIIYNLYGNGYVPDKESLNKFSDVSEEDWYSDAVAFAIDFGIINGYKDGTFRGDSHISREELSAIIAKFIKEDEYSTTEVNFTDIADSWAKESIEKLYRKNIVSGYGNSTFKPNGNTTRAEFVNMVNRLIVRPKTFNTVKEFNDLSPTHWAYYDIMNASNGSIIDTELDQSLLNKIKGE